MPDAQLSLITVPTTNSKTILPGLEQWLRRQVRYDCPYCERTAPFHIAHAPQCWAVQNTRVEAETNHG